MKQRIFNNWGLKILAVVMAIGVWFLVANIEDYSVTKTITNIPVTLTNEDAITSQGLVYSITEGETVNIQVKGRRSVVESLTAEDFVATANLSELSITNSVMVSVEAATAAVRKEVEIDIEDNVMKVAIEEEASKKLSIDVTCVGEVQSGYAVIATGTSPNMVTVKGAKSAVDNVDSAVVMADVDGLNENFTKSCEIVLLDANGNKIEQETLSLSTRMTRVKVTIQQTKEVPIEIHTIGEPREGYAVYGAIEYEPNTVLLAGDAATLDSIDSIKVDDLDLTDRFEDYETSIKPADYLPEGVSLTETAKKVSVVIHIHQLAKETVTFRGGLVEITGKQDGLSYEVATYKNGQEDYSVELVGFEEKVSGLRIKDLEPKVDVSEMTTPGVYNAKIAFAQIDGITYSDEVTVTVTVTRDTSTEGTTTATEE